MIKVSSIRNVKPVADAIKEQSLEKLKQFTYSDLMLYKAVVSAFGMLFGVIFVKFLRNLKWIIGIFAGAGAMYLAYKFFFKGED